MTVNLQLLGKPAGRREQPQRTAFFQTHNSEVSRRLCDLDLVISGGPDAIVAFLQPLKSNQRKPPFRRLQTSGSLLAPGQQVALPGIGSPGRISGPEGKA